MGKSAPTPPGRQTNPAMQVNDISPHAIGKSGMAETGAAGHVNLLNPGAAQPQKIQRGRDTQGAKSEGTFTEFSDPVTTAHFVGRDTPLTYGDPAGRKGFVGDPVSGEQVRGPSAHAPANFDIQLADGLYDTQADDREGFAGPNRRASRVEGLKGQAGKSKSPKQK